MTNEAPREFWLSKEELSCLRSLEPESQELARFLTRVETAVKGRHRIRLDRGEAEGIRDTLTLLLAKHGFKHDYSPSQQGKILEDLIDRFQVL